VSLESTTYPGTTDELVLGMLSEAHPELAIGTDFFLCFSPERVDPGNPIYHTKNTPKVVGGITPQCTEAGAALYGSTVDHVVPVAGTRVAEMVKLLENTFRLINIGLVNEMAMMCDRMNVNIWEVIHAASTKPFGFMPFYPGLGVGGHCIAVDPFYLSWKSKQVGMEARFIELAGQINGQMPYHAVGKIQSALNGNFKALKGSRIHMLGVAYKRDIDDVRESPAVDVAHLLLQAGVAFTYYDQFVPHVNIGGVMYHSSVAAEQTRLLEAADCVVIGASHTSIDYEWVLRSSQLVYDAFDVFRGVVDSRIIR